MNLYKFPGCIVTFTITTTCLNPTLTPTLILKVTSFNPEMWDTLCSLVQLFLLVLVLAAL